MFYFYIFFCFHGDTCRCGKVGVTRPHSDQVVQNGTAHSKRQQKQINKKLQSKQRLKPSAWMKTQSVVWDSQWDGSCHFTQWGRISPIVFLEFVHIYIVPSLTQRCVYVINRRRGRGSFKAFVKAIDKPKSLFWEFYQYVCGKCSTL